MRVARVAIASVLLLAVGLTAGGCVPRTAGLGGSHSSLDSQPATRSKVPIDALETTGLPAQSNPKVRAPAAPSASSTATGGNTSEAPTFSAEVATRHVRYLAGTIGVRQAGSSNEKRAADYIAAQLKALGYEPRIETFSLPTGKTSQNVIAEKHGATAWVLTLGAHMDSKAPSPGANDNASGCGALLAMASALANFPTAANVQFVFFGAEERITSDPDVHHLGSRYRVAHMSAQERAKTAGMLSVDMIGRGSELYVRNMRRGPKTLVDDLIAYARGRLPLVFKTDPGTSGWSDHEPYELAGIPVGWIESLPDSATHKTADVPSRVQASRERAVGQLLLSYVASRTEEDLADLRR